MWHGLCACIVCQGIMAGTFQTCERPDKLQCPWCSSYSVLVQYAGLNLVVAAFFLLPAEPSERLLQQCDKSVPSLLRCLSNHSISVSSAWYGRPGPTHCPGPSGHCPGFNVTADLQAKCNNRSTCIVDNAALPAVEGADPCVGVLKYVEVNYTCVAGECLRAMQPVAVGVLVSPGSLPDSWTVAVPQRHCCTGIS
jgi:hypothetical protein